ncbi:hypothetical protein PTKIN_Ptkin05aG0196100 [Pterospermum kingtungense]
MEKEVISIASKLANVLSSPCRFIGRCLFRVLRVGPIPNHIAFIMDGNRRYAKKKKQLQQQLDGSAAADTGHDAGFLALVLVLMYCYELGVKYVTAYAFSIDNFKRKPEEVQGLMEMMVAIKKLVEVTADHSNYVLTICVAYTCSDEILHAIRECCEEKYWNDDHGKLGIKLVDLEKHMYMAIAPDPDIVIRTGGEKRLSNFLLWQSSCSHLCTLFALWPEIGFWHLVWAVLNFQRNQPYFEEKKKKKKHAHVM